MIARICPYCGAICYSSDTRNPVPCWKCGEPVPPVGKEET